MKDWTGKDRPLADPASFNDTTWGNLEDWILSQERSRISKGSHLRSGIGVVVSVRVGQDSGPFLTPHGIESADHMSAIENRGDIEFRAIYLSRLGNTGSVFHPGRLKRKNGAAVDVEPVMQQERRDRLMLTLKFWYLSSNGLSFGARSIWRLPEKFLRPCASSVWKVSSANESGPPANPASDQARGSSTARTGSRISSLAVTFPVPMGLAANHVDCDGWRFPAGPLGGHEGALFLFPRVSDSLKSDWQRHVLASSGYLDLGMFDDAVFAFEEIAPEDKNRTEVLGARGVLYIAAKKWDMAATVASHLVKVEPENEAWWINLAYSVRRSEGIEQAAILLRARAIHPRFI